jgi:hypothetical protein
MFRLDDENDSVNFGDLSVSPPPSGAVVVLNFRPSLMFESEHSMDHSLPCTNFRHGANVIKLFCPYFKLSKTRLEKLVREKHSSLSRKFLNFGKKRFVTLGPGLMFVIEHYGYAPFLAHIG